MLVALLGDRLQVLSATRAMDVSYCLVSRGVPTFSPSPFRGHWLMRAASTVVLDRLSRPTSAPVGPCRWMN